MAGKSVSSWRALRLISARLAAFFLPLSAFRFPLFPDAARSANLLHRQARPVEQPGRAACGERVHGRGGVRHHGDDCQHAGGGQVRRVGLRAGDRRDFGGQRPLRHGPLADPRPGPLSRAVQRNLGRQPARPRAVAGLSLGGLVVLQARCRSPLELSWGMLW